MKKLLVCCASLFFIHLALSLEFMLGPPGEDIVGYSYVIASKKGDTLHKIARREHAGYYEIVEANNKLVQLDPLLPGTKIIIPMQFILPPGPRQGVVINLAEMRLYYYPTDGHRVETFPIGIGRTGWATPTAVTHIEAKVRNPSWYVPESIRIDALKRGITLPKIVAPGPKNPLGQFALRLGLAGYLIHGTNQPPGVGRRSSSGCIRLYPEDIQHLFERVQINTPVRIINQAYKAGWSHGQLYLEAHEPLREDIDLHHGQFSLTPMVSALVTAQHDHLTKVNWSLAERVASAEQGVPVIVGHLVKES